MRAGIWSLAQPLSALLGGNSYATGVDPATGQPIQGHFRGPAVIGERHQYTTKCPYRLKCGTWIQLLGNDVGKSMEKTRLALGVDALTLWGDYKNNGTGIDWCLPVPSVLGSACAAPCASVLPLFTSCYLLCPYLSSLCPSPLCAGVAPVSVCVCVTVCMPTCCALLCAVSCWCMPPPAFPVALGHVLLSSAPPSLPAMPPVLLYMPATCPCVLCRTVLPTCVRPLSVSAAPALAAPYPTSESAVGAAFSLFWHCHCTNTCTK